MIWSDWSDGQQGQAITWAWLFAQTGEASIISAILWINKLTLNPRKSIFLWRKLKPNPVSTWLQMDDFTFQSSIRLQGTWGKRGRISFQVEVNTPRLAYSSVESPQEQTRHLFVIHFTHKLNMPIHTSTSRDTSLPDHPEDEKEEVRRVK